MQAKLIRNKFRLVLSTHKLLSTCALFIVYMCDTRLRNFRR